MSFDKHPESDSQCYVCGDPIWHGRERYADVQISNGESVRVPVCSGACRNKLED